MSDLSRLFLPNPAGPAQPAQFRQARLVEFNPDDGTNMVQIGDSLIPNLPLARTGAEIGFTAGDNVIIMYLGNTAMIWCAIATPGSDNYGASNNGRASIVNNASGWGVPTAGNTVITDATTVVPGWANSAEIIMLGSASAKNTAAGAGDVGSQVRVSFPGGSDGFSSLDAQEVSSGGLAATFALYADTVDVTPGSVLTFSYTIFNGGTVAWSADANNHATMFAACQFFRESAS